MTATQHKRIVWNGEIGLKDIASVAYGASLELEDAAWERIRRARATVEKVLDAGELVYGLNTGLGSLIKYAVPRDELRQFNQEVIFGHALSLFPQQLSSRTVRAMIAARVAGFQRGGAGVRPELVQACLNLLERGVHPLVHARAASVGESDLAPMAEVGLVLIGRGEAEYQGAILSGAEALERAGLSPIALEAKEGLALISSNALSVGGGALALNRAGELLEMADIAAALSFEGFAANLGVLGEEALAARPFAGQRERGTNLRWLLEGSGLWIGEPRNLQDPSSFRCVPQVHGAVSDVLEDARDAVWAMLNGCVDSPLVTESGSLVSNGNFESTPLTFAFDTVRLALHRVVMMATQRVTKQLWNAFTGLPTALAHPSEPRVGMFHNMVNRTLAALTAHAYNLAAPALLSYTPQVTEGSDDYASMAPLSLDRLAEMLDVAHAALSLELLIARRAVALRPHLPAPRLGRVCTHLDGLASASFERDLALDAPERLHLERFISSLSPATLSDIVRES